MKNEFVIVATEQFMLRPYTPKDLCNMYGVSKKTLLMIEPVSEKSIEAGTALFLLVEVSAAVRVDSDTGVFDLTETATNELQYEHQGIIRLTNYSAIIQHVQMIQLILKDEQDANNNRKV